MNQIAEYYLTCGSWQEAQNIADSLLEQKLVACVEFIEVKSHFQWKQRIDESHEIKLIMTSLAHDFEAIEAVVQQLHSYETFVLKMLPVGHLNQAAQQWLTDVTRQK